MTIYDQYAHDVINGVITSNKYIKSAANQYLINRNRSDLEFRVSDVNEVIEFCSLFTLYDGAAAGQPFVLFPWMQFFIANIYGFYYSGTNRRKYRTGVLFIARKNAKTMLSSILSLYELIQRGNPQVFLSSYSYKQSQIAYKMVKVFAEQLDPKSNFFDTFRDSLLVKGLESTLYVLSNNPKATNGYGAKFYIVDEYAQHEDSAMRDVLKSSQKTIDNPLELIISSSSIYPEYPFFRVVELVRNVLDNKVVAEEIFGMLFELDEGDNWRIDESCWAKPNPNLPYIPTMRDNIRSEVSEAATDIALELETSVKTFNEIKSNTIDKWLKLSDIDASMVDTNLEWFVNKPIYVSLDFAVVSDMCSLTIMYVDESKELPEYHYYTRNYLPESALIESPNRELYKICKKSGDLIMTPGNVIDYEFIYQDIINISKQSEILDIYYDRAYASKTITDLTEYGLPCCEVAQNLYNFNKGTREFEKNLRSCHVHISRNQCVKWMMSNAVIISDHNNNIKPAKKHKSSRYKIDAVIAMVQAMCGYHLTEHFTYSGI